MRDFLGATGYSSFFENVPNIISILTQVPSHRFTVEQKEQLNAIFLNVQAPYEKHKGRRKNFLSYAYVLLLTDTCVFVTSLTDRTPTNPSYITYKMCELLSYTEFLPLLRLLDHRNLLSADAIWRKICKELKYEFISKYFGIIFDLIQHNLTHQNQSTILGTT